MPFHIGGGHGWGSTSTADESHSVGCKLRKFINFYRDLSAPTISTDMSQVTCYSLLFKIFFLSFYLSRFSFYINTDVLFQS
jgi:hypothetical protein